jgi:ABC-2 type transport system permease protein
VSTLRAQTQELARRSILRTLRQPAQIVPPIVFPLILLAVNVGGLKAATKLPGFPADSYLDFAIGMAFMQGALFAMISSGSDLARDVETGFLKRLALTPMQRVALLVGQLAGQLVLSLVCTLVYLGVALAFGMDVKAGFAGVLVVVALAMLIAVGFGAMGALVGLRAGSGEAVQGFFPLFFVALFLSSTNLPRNLMEQDWFRTIATYNPVSYLVEGLRAPIISGWDGEALAMGFGIALAIAVLALYGAAAAVRTRVVRT